jgi:plasmid stabilization system protein ParE
MYKLVFQPLAFTDIQEITSYYDLITPQLADAFLMELENTKKHITKMPESSSLKLGNIRVVFLKRFKYGVYFKIYPKLKIVNIIAIIHTSRNPNIWKKR